ncbi:MAG: TolC family protein [Bacteroidota bacterium]|nr:TolC family protein [Bacteroidota bacterium]
MQKMINQSAFCFRLPALLLALLPGLLAAPGRLCAQQAQQTQQAPRDSAAQPVMGLREVLETALKNSLGMRIARNNVSIAGTYNSYGYAGGLPLVTATASDVQSSNNLRQEFSNPANNKNSTNAPSNNVSAGLSASELVFNGGRVRAAKGRLDSAESQSRQLLNSRALALIFNVTLKYYDIIRQQSYARTLQSSIDVSREKLRIVQAQQAIGLANNADLFQSQVDLNTQLQNLQAQQLVVEQDKTDLLTLMTLDPNSSIGVEDTILVDRDLRLGTILSGVQSNPDIAAADQQVSIARFLERETGALRYPSLYLDAGYNLGRTQNAQGFSLLNLNYGPYAGVTVNIPIFNGGIYRRQHEAANYNTRNAALLKDTLLQNYTSNAVKNWQAYSNNLQQLETAKANYDLSRRLLDLVLQRFQLRQATIVDVKNAQQSFENAGFLLTNVSFAAKSAEIQLKRYANLLTY